MFPGLRLAILGNHVNLNIKITTYVLNFNYLLRFLFRATSYPYLICLDCGGGKNSLNKNFVVATLFDLLQKKFMTIEKNQNGVALRAFYGLPRIRTSHRLKIVVYHALVMHVRRCLNKKSPREREEGALKWKTSKISTTTWKYEKNFYDCFRVFPETQ